MKKLTKEQIEKIAERIINDFFFPSDTAINITRVKFIKTLNTALESLGEEEVCQHDWVTSGLYARFCRKCKATEKINRTKTP